MRNLYLGRFILALAAIYKWKEIINFIHDFVPVQPIYIKGSLIIIFVYYFANTIRSSILKLLLSYHGWMFDSPRKQSLTTKLWFITMQIFKLKKPKTHDYEAYLPNQPVPKLKSTLDNYVNSYKGLLTEEEFQKLKTDASDFAQSGKEIQAKIKQRALIGRHYNASSWLKDHYLTYSGSLMNVNMFGADTLSPPTNALASRAASITAAYIEFYQLIASNKLKPMMLQNIVPMDMNQFRQLFCTTRIAGEKGDSLVTKNGSDYIVVTNRHRWYTINIYTDKTIYNESKKNSLVNAKELEEAFETIINDTREATILETNLAKMTALPRKEWSKIRRRLVEITPNIDKIESALMHICLDQLVPETKDASTLSKLWLTGNGQRWFDKSITLHFLKNGYFGAGYDHTWGDGLATMYAYDFAIKNELDKIQYDSSGKISNVDSRVKVDLTPLRFDDDLSIPEIKETGQQYENMTAEVDVKSFNINYGKSQIKKMRTSPDAVIQLALQIAYFEYNEKMPLTYEAAITTIFDLGRTETIRTNTNEMSEVVRLISASVEVDKVKTKLIKCLNAHSEQSKKAMVGYGFDRHMFALSNEAKKQNLKSDLLDFYRSESFDLSTSMLPWGMSGIRLPKDYDILGGGFYYPWGIGVCYLPRDNYTCFTVTTSNVLHSSEKFKSALEKAFDKIMDYYK